MQYKSTYPLTVSYYLLNESKKNDPGYPKLCMCCTYTPVWVVKQQPLTTNQDVRTEYACGEHVDTVMFRLANDVDF